MRCLCLILAAGMAHAEVRRALLVGIDDYIQPAQAQGYQPSERTRVRLKAIDGSPSRRKLDRLEGAFNDAKAMKEILIERFGFEESNVIILPNPSQPATADNILGLLQTLLIDQAQQGDVSLFYFAGHGSRIRNTAARNDNPTGFDSTIIPADALAGVPDIRGKELARIYAQAAKKHVTLTVIQDSCFSGAASRGSVARNRIRAQPPDLGISVNETLDVPLPEDSGVLVLSASQDYEPAAELSSTDLNGPHGAFTWALLHVLGASPADDRVDRIFQRVRALMQSQAPGQEPVLLAKNGLNSRGLFGQAPKPGQAVTVAAARVNLSQVKLNGGLAMNLHEGCELRRIAPADPPVRLRITNVNDLSSSNAVIVEGANVKPGDLFELDKWVAPDREILRVYLGAPAPFEEIRRAAQTVAELRRRALVKLVEDPTEHPPTHIVQWVGSGWTFRENSPAAKSISIGQLSADRLAKIAPAEARIYVLIPPPESFRESKPFGASVAKVDSVDRADYVLLGRVCAETGTACIEYAWALPDITEEDLRRQRPARPLRSDWIPSNNETAASLRSAGLALARVAGWLELSDSNASAWPYQLALERADTHRLVETRVLRGGEEYKLVLRADPELLRSSAFVPPRRVYVFVVDSWGHAKLVFGESNLQNEFPRFDGVSAPAPESIPLTNSSSDLAISEPYGVDHYFLLTTSNPIDSPETILNFDGARTRGAERIPDDPLARLLRNTATATRGEVARVPMNWSIRRLTILSKPPANTK
jgi:hypothetical protein